VNPAAQVGLQTVHRVALPLVSLLLLALILELVRRRLLRERYALLWLVTAGTGLLIGFFPGIIVRLSQIFHFQYLTVLFVLSFLFLIGLVLSFSVVISRLSERNRELAQEVALLANALERLENKTER